MTDYERIKAACKARSELWVDPDFPSSQASVFYYQTPPFNFVWKRPKDIYQNPKFVLDNCEMFDVVRGKLGDKWMVSCLGMLYLCKGLFYRVVPADQRVDSADYVGVFRFRIWWCGQWMEVLVDDRLPTVNGKLVFLQTSNSEQLWPALLEKAYAKLHGSYEALKYGCLVDGLADLTGGITETIPVPGTNDISMLKNLLDSTSIVTANYAPPDAEDNHKALENEMNYRICEVKEVETQDGPVQLVRFRRPQGSGDVAVKHIVFDDDIWMSIPARERERLTAPTVKGFWVLFEELPRLFSRVEMAHLDVETCRAEPLLMQKNKWQMRMYQGGWRRGVSAGGCRNHVNFFHMNPQVQIVLSEPGTVIVSLNQHSIMEPKIIGFSIYRMPQVLIGTAEPILFRHNKFSINSQYTNSRQVSHRCQLQTGVYLVMPTTFEPREEANFTLRVFSHTTQPMKMKVLDDSPQVIRSAVVKAPSHAEKKDAMQYETLFLHLANDRRSINIFELQELLDACLPNDYIKSCASIDTCRQIVLSLDKNGTGRISLSDFKDLMCSLKHWQLVFKHHAREKMGVLRAESLRDALKDAGLVVPHRVLTLVVLRYMRKDGMLRFGDYVSAVLHLNRAFEVYYNNIEDIVRGQSKTIRMSLSEWLHNAFMC